jgi:hypothetical protein
MKSFSWVFLSVILILGLSCRQSNDQIPLVSVDIYLNINEPSNFSISAVGGFDYYTGGSEGIIVYRNSLQEFNAYDRHAPYNVDDRCRVVVLDDNVIIEDPCSESQWVITDGSIIRGPTSQPLHTYQANFNDPILHIFN